VIAIRKQLDLSLLVLRGTALLLLVLYGWNKLTWVFPLISGNQAWESWGFALQIGKLGFPVPVLLAVFVVFCESFGAFLIAVGFFTRFFATLAALSMAGAMYFSLRVGEAAWQLAALYLLAFVALALVGPGKFSVDHFVQVYRKGPQTADINI
jgi:putative oxidoreductase